MNDMQPENGQRLSPSETDREGAMAKADLYKLANYSLKLFKQMHDDDQLESWVQAKITKAADYIASVYHYMEYEMKFSEYGEHLANAEVYNEGAKAAIANKLMEAKEKVKELKKLQAEKKQKGEDKKEVAEGILNGGEAPCEACGGSGTVHKPARTVKPEIQDKIEKYKTLVKATKSAHKRMDANKNGIPDEDEMEEGFGDAEPKEMKVGDTKKTRTGELTKTSTGVIHKNTSYHDEGDEIASNAKSGKGTKSHAKAQSAAEKKDRAPALKQSPKSAKTWGMKDGSKFDNRDKTVDENFGQGVYAEGAKSKKADKDYDGDGKVESGKDEYLGSKIAAAKKSGKLKESTCSVCHEDPCECTNEDSSPSAGMSKKQKSAVVKDAKAGKDIGKPGKSFDKVAKAAGGGEKGKKIAAAAMWKNKAKSIKESLDAQLDEAALDQSLDALIQKAGQADPQGLQAAVQQGGDALQTYLEKFLQTIETQVDAAGGAAAPGATPGATPGQATASNDMYPDANTPATPPTEQEPLSESIDLARMKTLMTRLNG